MKDTRDESIAAIQNLLTQLQEATTNTGGSYAFFRMPLPEGESLVARIQQYLIESNAQKETAQHLHF